MGRISFFLKEAFGSLRRNYFMTIAALVTVFLSIVVLGGVLVFVYTTDALLKEVEQKVEITVYLKTDPDPTQDQIDAMQAEIWLARGQELGLRQQAGRARPAEGGLQGQPGDPRRADRQPAARLVRDIAGRSADGGHGGGPVQRQQHRRRSPIRQGDSRQAVQRHLAGPQLPGGFIVLLGIVAVLLISNTIRLSIFARKREVEIMKLVGATNWFIRWPFIIEGVTVGLGRSHPRGRRGAGRSTASSSARSETTSPS